MANLKDKIRALRALLKDNALTDEILAQIELKELEARVAGVDTAYKDQARDIRQLVAQVKALGGDVPDAAMDTGFLGFVMGGNGGGATVI